MAELAIGAVGLIALESTVDSFFTKASTWRHYGKDFEQHALSLDLASIAYKRWRKSVKLMDGTAETNVAKMTVASDEEASTVVRLLGTIQLAFQNAEKTMERYAGDEPAMAPNATSSDLAARVYAVNKARQSNANAFQKARWVFRDAKSFKELAETVSRNVDGLIKVFPPAIQNIQEQLAAVDLQDIVPPGSATTNPGVLTAEKRDLAQVRDVAASIDPILQQVADEEIPQVGRRHLYDRNVSEQNARAYYGDEIYGQDDPGRAGSVYTNNLVRGNARAQYGDRVNPPSSFWDD